MKKMLLLLAVIGFAIAAVWWLLPWPELESREAVYWIRGVAWQNAGLPWEESAKRRLEALKEIGEPAIKVLIHDLRSNDEGVTTYMKFLRAMPPGVQRILPRAQMQFSSRHGAALLLGQLGPQAKPAVPYLLELLRSGDRFARHDAARALGGIGENTPRVLSALTNAYADSAVEVRHAAAMSVWFLNHADEQAATLVESMLTNTNRKRLEVTGGDCYYALIAAGPVAKRFGPALAEGMTNISSLTAKTLAAKALWRIKRSPDPALYVLDAITNALANVPHPVSNPRAPNFGPYGDIILAVQELTEIPEFRRAVEPYLATLTNSPNPTLAGSASNHLKRIQKMDSLEGAKR